MMKNKISLLSMLLCLNLLSCINQSSKVTKSKNANNSPLTGIWNTGCINNNSESYKLVFTFESNGNSTLEETFFSNINCAEGEEEERWKTFYTYTDDLDVLNFTRTKVEMSVHNSVLRDARNTDSWCGFNNWSIDVIKDVTNIVCDGFETSTSESPINPTYSINSGNLEFNGYDHFTDETFIKIQ